MTTDNTIIDSATTGDTPVDAPKVDNNEVENEEVVSGDDQDGQEGDTEDTGDDLPKNVKKALDKNKRYIRNLREREKALRAEIEKLKGEKFEPKQVREEEFQGSYGEFIEARAIEKMRAELGQNQQKQQLDQLSLQQQQIVAEQMRAVSEEVAEYAKQSQDYAKVVSESSASFDALPAEVQNLFLELESPTLACYALAKEGRIEQLAYMSPYMAAAEIYQAQARGQQYYQSSLKKPVSNAPAPVGGLKGSAPVKSEETLSGMDLLKKYNLK